MEGKEFLIRLKSAHEKGLTASQNFLDSAQQEGWAERTFPDKKHAQHLYLANVDPKTKFTNLLRPLTGIAAIRNRIENKVIPHRLAKIDTLTKEIESLEQVEKEAKTPEELTARKEIFTPTQAGFIAAAILQRKDIPFVSPATREVLFRFEIDQQTEAYLKETGNLSLDLAYLKLTEGAKRDLRVQTLNELNLLLSSHELLNQALDNDKFSEPMKLFLIWLSEQNDKLGGYLCQVLAVNPQSDYTYDSSRLQHRGLQSYILIPPEIAPIIRYLNPKSTGQSPMYGAATESKPTELKIPVIERRDKEIRQKLNQYWNLVLDQFQDSKLSDDNNNSGGRVTRSFPKFKEQFINWIVDEKHHLHPTISRDGFHSSFTLAEIVKMHYIYNHSYRKQTVDIDAAMSAELDRIIAEQRKIVEQNRKEQTEGQK